MTYLYSFVTESCLFLGLCHQKTPTFVCDASVKDILLVGETGGTCRPTSLSYMSAPVHDLPARPTRTSNWQSGVQLDLSSIASNVWMFINGEGVVLKKCAYGGVTKYWGRSIIIIIISWLQSRWLCKLLGELGSDTDYM